MEPALWDAPHDRAETQRFGMFEWVRAFIDDVSSASTQVELRGILAEFPKELASATSRSVIKWTYAAHLSRPSVSTNSRMNGGPLRSQAAGTDRSCSPGVPDEADWIHFGRSCRR